MRDAVTAGLGLLAGITLLVLTLGGRSGQADRDPLNSHAVLFGIVLGGHAVIFGIVLGGLIADSGLVPGKAVIQGATAGFALCLVAALLVFRSKRKAAVGAATRRLLIATWAWTYIIDLTMSPPSSKTELIGRTVSGLFLFVMISFASWSGLSLRSFALTTAVMLSLVGLSLPLLSDAWVECTSSKCNILGSLLRGPFPSENDLGMLSAWVAIFALVGLRGSERWLSYALAAAMLVASDSRTSLYITLALSAAYFARHFIWRDLIVVDEAGYKLRRSAASSVVIIFAGLSLALLYTAGPHTLSNRGDIWGRALTALQGHLVLGLGLDRWEPLTLEDVLPDHFPHSEYLLLIFSGGYVALALFLAFIWSTLVHPHAHPEDVMARLLMVVMFLSLSLTEVSWNPLTIDSLSWTVLALLAVGVAAGDSNAFVHPPPRAPRQGRTRSSLDRARGSAVVASRPLSSPTNTPRDRW